MAKLLGRAVVQERPTCSHRNEIASPLEAHFLQIQNHESPLVPSHLTTASSQNPNRRLLGSLLETEFLEISFESVIAGIQNDQSWSRTPRGD